MYVLKYVPKYNNFFLAANRGIWSNRVNLLFAVTNCEQGVNPVWPGFPLLALSMWEQLGWLFLTSLPLFAVTNCEQHRIWALGLEALTFGNKLILLLFCTFFIINLIYFKFSLPYCIHYTRQRNSEGDTGFWFSLNYLDWRKFWHNVLAYTITYLTIWSSFCTS